MASAEIERLIQLLAKLPGLGPRSARRAALHMVKRKDHVMDPLARALTKAVARVTVCSACGNVDTADPCGICTDPRRDPTVLCVVEEVGDLWAMERSAVFRGRYHVLGGTLSALDGVGPDELRIPSLIDRATDPVVAEVILATNATVEGQTTAHYISDQLNDAGVTLTALAHGVPVGGELDYLDDGTLAAAMKARRMLHS
ncbi:MAG: recombination mediator RecR [Rhodospirillaceae bacterium]|nr:recombination mediator RecR [Rhodospirillaceae bacterium]MCY4311760.1 recombination mediator RecR [Rhodospirillaceae bacterium]